MKKLALLFIGLLSSGLTTTKPDQRIQEVINAAYVGNLLHLENNLKMDLPLDSQVGTRNFNALIAAAAGGHVDIVDRLFQAKADLNPNLKDSMGKTALIHAAKDGRTDIVNRLLKAKANLDIKDSMGKTALMYATENSHTNIVKALKNAGASS